VTINQENTNGKHFWKGKIITSNQQSKTKMYLRVTLNIDGVQRPELTHRLVAKAFVSRETEDRNQVNHKDGNPKNNSYRNLEWVTAQENKDHAIATGLQWYLEGEQKSEAKLTEVKVWEILCLYYLEFEFQTSIAATYGLHPQYISLVTRGERWNKVFKKFVEIYREEYESSRYQLASRHGAYCRQPKGTK
jgi:hypothetical protein